MKALTYIEHGKFALMDKPKPTILVPKILPVIICFVMFLVNDLYGFVSWKRMEKRQTAAI